MKLLSPDTPEVLWSVDLPAPRNANFGVIVKDGKVIETAPYGNWMIGHFWSDVAIWILSKGGTLYDHSQGGIREDTLGSRNL